MKKALITLFGIAVAIHVNCQGLPVPAVPGPKPSPTAAFHWANTAYDFGKTKIGIPVSYEFRFRNTGFSPLIISSVKASCGCTVTAYTKEPVEHGASGFVKATYNAGQRGVYSKTVAVSANTPDGIIQLTVKGEIVE